MKRHKRKQKQWSKKSQSTMLPLTLATYYTLPSFPELAILDRMMEDPEMTAILKDTLHMQPPICGLEKK